MDESIDIRQCSRRLAVWRKTPHPRAFINPDAWAPRRFSDIRLGAIITVKECKASRFESNFHNSPLFRIYRNHQDSLYR